jgi:dTDP-4-dehydrorhamnose reductase
MRTLVLGGGGMLGSAVLAAALARGWPALALSHAQCDIGDEAPLDHWMADFAPEAVINCAAFTRVDDCETQPERALVVNGEAVGRVARAAERRGARQLRVVGDQVGAPTYTGFLARALLDLAPLAATGIVHYRNREPVSWYSFAAAIVRRWPGADGVVEVVPVSTAEMPRPAPRPAYSVLAVERCEALLGRPVESWERGLEEYLSQQGRSR